MVNENARDTQFRVFAELLFDDLPWNDINIDMEKKGWEERWQAKIARRAYDLACHVLDTEKVQWCELEEISMNDIPDMTELPEEQEHGR